MKYDPSEKLQEIYDKTGIGTVEITPDEKDIEALWNVMVPIPGGRIQIYSMTYRDYLLFITPVLSPEMENTLGDIIKTLMMTMDPQYDRRHGVSYIHTPRQTVVGRSRLG